MTIWNSLKNRVRQYCVGILTRMDESTYGGYENHQGDHGNLYDTVDHSFHNIGGHHGGSDGGGH